MRVADYVELKQYSSTRPQYSYSQAGQSSCLKFIAASALTQSHLAPSCHPMKAYS
jgi:hypothetical protein